MNKINTDKEVDKALAAMLAKYEVISAQPFQLKQGTDLATLNMVPGYFFPDTVQENNQVPLLTWRVRRKFIELKKIIEDSVIENVCLFRFSCMGSKDRWSLYSLFYREMDLFEFIANGKIISVQAVISHEEAGNAILRLDNGALCSIEVSIQMPSCHHFIDRHEIIARRGVASDLVVDSQVPQSSIYSFTNIGENRYTDVDMELFGFDDLQIDHIRSAFLVLKDPGLIKRYRQQHNHLVALTRMAFDSERTHEKILL